MVRQMEAEVFEDVFDALSDTRAEAAQMKARAELLSALVQHLESGTYPGRLRLPGSASRARDSTI